MNRNRAGSRKGKRMTPQPAGVLDSFSMCRPGQTVAPSVVACGQLGSGNSSLPRPVYVLPPIILLDLASRRAGAVEEATPPGVGEYEALARRRAEEGVS